MTWYRLSASVRGLAIRKAVYDINPAMSTTCGVMCKEYNMHKPPIYHRNHHGAGRSGSGPTPSPTSSHNYTGLGTAHTLASRLLAPAPAPCLCPRALKSIISKTSWNIKESCTPCGFSLAPRRPCHLSASGVTSGTSIRRGTRRIMELPSDPDFDDALPKLAYRELLEAFCQRHCKSVG